MLVQEVKDILWKQFAGSLEMLANAINFCPDTYWDTKAKFWYNAFHCLFFTDYYLTLQPIGFEPPPPFTLSEFEEGAMPDKVYTKQELLDYLQFNRNKAREVISGLTADTLTKVWVNQSQTMHYPVMELLLYNMRHIQHHTAQLNLLLRQSIDDAPDWVGRTKEAL